MSKSCAKQNKNKWNGKSRVFSNSIDYRKKEHINGLSCQITNVITNSDFYNWLYVMVFAHCWRLYGGLYLLIYVVCCEGLSHYQIYHICFLYVCNKWCLKYRSIWFIAKLKLKDIIKVKGNTSNTLDCILKFPLVDTKKYLLMITLKYAIINKSFNFSYLSHSSISWVHDEKNNIYIMYRSFQFMLYRVPFAFNQKVIAVTI